MGIDARSEIALQAAKKVGFNFMSEEAIAIDICSGFPRITGLASLNAAEGRYGIPFLGSISNFSEKQSGSPT